MKNVIFLISINLFVTNINAQIKIPSLKTVCNNPLPMQQIGGPRVILDSLLVYQICIDGKASDNKNPIQAKHLVGAVKVSNNSKSIYQVRVYYFWKGNQITTKLTIIKPKETQLYPFDMTVRRGKESENTMIEVRSDQTKKITKFPIIK
jgi:hypothetical protein